LPVVLLGFAFGHAGRREFLTIPMRPYAAVERSCQEPSPEQFGGLCSSIKISRICRFMAYSVKSRTGGRARDNYELFRFVFEIELQHVRGFF